jgi:hypothetical protein
MKRNFLMKAFVCMFTVVALSSCNKDDDDGDNGAIDNTLKVAVENGNSLNEKIAVVKLIIWPGDKEYASVEYKDGGFTLTLPENLSSQDLGPFDDDDFHYSIKISNENVKYGWAFLEAYKSGRYVGDFYLKSGDWEGYPVYADGDVSITGTYTETEEYDGYTRTDTEKYNVNLKKGWNIVYEKGQGTENGTTYTYTYEATTTAPVGVKWYFESYDYDESSVSGSRAKTPFLQGKQKLRF